MIVEPDLTALKAAAALSDRVTNGDVVIVELLFTLAQHMKSAGILLLRYGLKVANSMLKRIRHSIWAIAQSGLIQEMNSGVEDLIKVCVWMHTECCSVCEQTYETIIVAGTYIAGSIEVAEGKGY